MSAKIFKENYFSKNERRIRLAWLATLALANIILPLLTLSLFFFAGENSSSGLSQTEVQFIILIVGTIKFLILWSCAYRKNGIKLLKVLLWLTPISLLKELGNVLHIGFEAVDLIDYAIATGISILGLWLTWKIYKVNQSKLKKEVLTTN